MTSNQVLDLPLSVAASGEIIFAGDEVRLAGQIDYPTTARPENGYPLLFVLHHACCTSREDYNDYARLALTGGYAVFRWDQRGTGRSGDSGRGSTTQDAVNAYETALLQPDVNRRRIVILAVGAGTALLGSSFGLFARTQTPYAVLLVANMLDEQAVLALDTRIKIVMSPEDWNAPTLFGEAASAAHMHAYKHGASFFLSDGGDRLLMTAEGVIDSGARKAIGDWLKSLTRRSAFS
jgi:pimeloyl-ACP methyl ester carboxylesterase